MEQLGERTFENSGVRPYSWPCILVLVDRWEKEKDGAGVLNPTDVVPDIVWKKFSSKVSGGRDINMSVKPEHPTHYADIDEPGANGSPSLMQLCLDDIANVDV